MAAEAEVNALNRFHFIVNINNFFADFFLDLLYSASLVAHSVLFFVE
jgi:hypothetical protein